MKRRVSAIKHFLDAQRAYIDSNREIVSLMRWLAFVSLVQAAKPAAFRDVYEHAYKASPVLADRAWDEAEPVLMDTDGNAQVVYRLIYCRIVDRFLAYLAMLAECVYENDDSLLPNTKLQLAEVLEHESLGQLIAQQAKQAAFDLTFSTSRLVKTTTELAGVDAAEIQSDLDSLEDAIEIRNAVTHRTGTVDQRLLDRRPGFPGKLGEPIRLDDDSVSDLYDLVDRLTLLFNASIEAKRGITPDVLRRAAESAES